MSPLPDSIRHIGDEILAYYSSRGLGEAPPYIVYVYRPKDEFKVRQELFDLRSWLEAKGITCFAVSLADLFWQALDESGFADQIIQAEQSNPGDLHTLALVHTSITQILTGPPSLSDRVLTALADASDRSVAFLYRAGALFPSYRTSAILEDLRERLHIPVVLLYPGHLEGAYWLRFMGRCEPAHSYRAKIIPREAA